MKSIQEADIEARIANAVDQAAERYFNRKKKVFGLTIPEIIAGGSVIATIAGTSMWLEAGIQRAETHAENIEKIHKIDVDNIKDNIDRAEANIIRHIEHLREEVKK